MSDAGERRIRFGRLALEALAIFSGVTAGFLADDYRQQRNEVRQEREALEQMLRDLEIDADDIRPIVERSRRISEAMTWLHNNLPRLDVPADSVRTVLEAMPFIYTYEAANAAYTGLKEAGQLGLIRDLELRRELVFYSEDRQAAMEALNEFIIRDEERWWDLLAEHVTYGPASDFRDVGAPIRTLDVAAMRRDRRLLQHLWWNGGGNQGQADDGQVVLDLNAELAGRVRAYLEAL